MDKDKEILDAIRKLLKEPSGGNKDTEGVLSGWKEEAGIETVTSDTAYEVYGDGFSNLKVENKTYRFRWTSQNIFYPDMVSFSGNIFLDTLEKLAFLNQYSSFEREHREATDEIDENSKVFKLFTDVGFIKQRDEEVADKTNKLPILFVCQAPWVKYIFQERRLWTVEKNEEGNGLYVSARFAFAPLPSKAVQVLNKDDS